MKLSPDYEQLTCLPESPLLKKMHPLHEASFACQLTDGLARASGKVTLPPAPAMTDRHKDRSQDGSRRPEREAWAGSKVDSLPTQPLISRREGDPSLSGARSMRGAMIHLMVLARPAAVPCAQDGTDHPQ